MRLSSFDDPDFNDYAENLRLNGELARQRKRADEAIELLTALVQLKMMKGVEPEFYEGTKEEVWKLATKFLVKDNPVLKRHFRWFKSYATASPEVRENYRSQYERLFGKDD